MEGRTRFDHREELQRINAVDLYVVLKNLERFGNTTARIGRKKSLIPPWKDEPGSITGKMMRDIMKGFPLFPGKTHYSSGPTYQTPKFSLPSLEQILKDFNDSKKEATPESEQTQVSEPEPTKKSRPNIAKVVVETDLETGNVMVKELIGFKSLCEITEKYGDGVVGRYTKDLHYMVKNTSYSIFIRNLDIYVNTGACYTAKRWKEILMEILACGEALSADIKAVKMKALAAEAALKIQCAGRGVRGRKTETIEI
jgi:hypothetical protein